MKKKQKSSPQSKRKQQQTSVRTIDEIFTDSHAQTYRMQRINVMLTEAYRAGNPKHIVWNCTTLGKEIGYGPDTIKTDIRDMKALGMPLTFMYDRRGYIYTEEVTSLPTMQFSRGELMSLCFAMQGMEPFRTMPFASNMRTAIQKLTVGMRRELMLEFERLESRLCFRSTGLDAFLDPDVFETAMRATLDQREITFEYDKVHGDPDDDFGRRRLEPLCMACIDNGWYLFGWDLDREKIRSFAITRMKDVQFTGRWFTDRRNFDLEKEMDDSFGAFRSGKKVDVVLQFRGNAARLVPERLWHRTQSFTNLKGGVIEMKMTVTQSPELVSWIAKWGGLGRAIAPTKLKDAVEKAHAEGLAWSREPAAPAL